MYLLLANFALDQHGVHRVGDHRHAGLQTGRGIIFNLLSIKLNQPGPPRPHLQHVGEQRGECEAVGLVSFGAVTVHLNRIAVEVDWEVITAASYSLDKT